jgi:hypothetical protein
VEGLYLLFTLLCPLSMVALMGWWFWSMRKSSGTAGCPAEPTRSAVEEGELTRMRARLDQRHAAERDTQQQPA